MEGVPAELLSASAGHRLTVCAGASAAELLASLGEIPGALGVMASGEADGFATVHYEVEPGADPRDVAFDRLHAAGIRIRELRLDEPTLEQFFAQVTADEQLQEVAV